MKFLATTRIAFAVPARRCPWSKGRHTTAWGAAPNFDDFVHGFQLRRFVIANAIHWFDEYHIDGLRVDAIHCMRDDSERHVAAELSQAVKDWSSESGRFAMMIVPRCFWAENV